MNADLLTALSANDGLRLLLIMQSIWVRDVSVQLVPQKLLHQSHLTVVALRGVPDVGPSFSVALSLLPLAGE